MPALVKDLVCGMEIDPETAAATSEYRGTTYYFCAPGCKTDFDADPESYISGEASKSMDGTTSGGKRWWEFWKT
jgi:YHS domain-containing protein